MTKVPKYWQLLTVTDTYKQVTDTNLHLQYEIEEKGRQETAKSQMNKPPRAASA